MRLGWSLKRLPSDTTLRRLFHSISMPELTTAFNDWAMTQFEPDVGECLSMDGKSLSSTLTGHTESFQNFVGVVSLYSHRHRLVIAQTDYQNKLESEISVVQSLLETLELSGVTVTFDALHCQKKTVQQLALQGNHYVVTVKGNQGNLKKQFEQVLTQPPQTKTVELDCSHGRWVERYVRIYAAPAAVYEHWPDAKSMIVVERYGEREGHFFNRISYYLSDLELTAKAAASIVRGHRDIENGLHWVKDVVLHEDASLITQRIPALNWAVFRSIGLNLFRAAGYSSLTKAIRKLGHDIEGLLFLLTMN